jgi:hypothetical protein
VPDYRAIVDEEEIGDATEAFEGFAFVCANGLVAQVATRGHDREAESREEEMMQRRVREHDPKVGVAGGQGRRKRRSVKRGA